MTHVPQQRLHSVERTLLGTADPGDHGRRKLGAQRDSQPTGGARGGGDESALRDVVGGGVEEQCGVFDCPAQRAIDAQPVPGVLPGSDGDAAALRLESVEPAPTGRDTDRTGTVGSQRQRSKAGGHSR